MTRLEPIPDEPDDDVEATAPNEPASVAVELGAMKKLVNALAPLDDNARARVLRWLVDRYQHAETKETPA